MASAAEMMEGLQDYAKRCNENAKLRKMFRTWSRTVHFSALDTGDILTTVILNGELIEVVHGASGTPDLIIAGTSEDLTDMFWGDLNPAAKYLTGEIKVQGAQDDVLRVDAMASLMWVDG